MSNTSIVFAVTCFIIWSVQVNVFVLGVDECDTGIKTCPENSDCQDPDVNTNGTATCTCRPGFTGNETSCKDIQECSTLSDACPGEGSQCENTQGSYLCLCKRGFTELANGTCVRKDDCTKLPICHENEDCIADGGAFNCTCKSGYTRDGENCTDVNECEGQHSCSSNATCENVPGSYECICKIKVERGVSCQVSSYCPTRGAQDNDCTVVNDDDDDDTVIILVSITIVLLTLCLIALIIAIFCVYKKKICQ